MLYTNPSDSTSIRSPEYNALDRSLFKYQSSLKTILYLSTGPIISQLFLSVDSVMTSVWLGKCFPQNGLSINGSTFIPKSIISSASIMIFVTVCVRFGQLSGKNVLNPELHPYQVFTIHEVFPIILVMCLILIIVIPISKPIFDFLSVKHDIRQDCIFYLMPEVFGFIITGIFQIILGLINSSGHPIIYGITDAARHISSCLIFQPLLLFVFKTGIWGVTLSGILAELLVSLIVMLFLIKKSYSLKNIKIKFSKESLSIAASSIISSLSIYLPSMVIQKLLSDATPPGESKGVMGAWSVMATVYGLCGSIVTAITKGLYSAVAFDTEQQNKKHARDMLIWTLFIGTLWATVISAVFAFYPKAACVLWSKDHKLDRWIIRMLPPSVYCAPLQPVRAIGTAFLQASGHKVCAGSLNLFGQLAAISLSGYVLFKLGMDPGGIVYCYCISDSIAFILSLISLIVFTKLN